MSDNRLPSFPARSHYHHQHHHHQQQQQNESVKPPDSTRNTCPFKYEHFFLNKGSVIYCNEDVLEHDLNQNYLMVVKTGLGQCTLQENVADKCNYSDGSWLFKTCSGFTFSSEITFNYPVKDSSCFFLSWLGNSDSSIFIYAKTCVFSMYNKLQSSFFHSQPGATNHISSLLQKGTAKQVHTHIHIHSAFHLHTINATSVYFYQKPQIFFVFRLHREQFLPCRAQGMRAVRRGVTTQRAQQIART